MVENYIKWSEATEPEENKEKYLWYNEGVCKVWNGYMWVVVNQDINVIAEELVPLTIARKTDLINMLRNLSIESIDGNIDWIDDLRDAIAEKLDKSEFEEFKNGLNNQLNGIDIRLGRLENDEGGSGSGPDQTRIDTLEERMGNAEEDIIDLDRRVTVLENTSGGGSTPGEQGDPGRSVTSIDSYYKLSELKVGEETPALSIADPTIAGWRKTSSSPTEALPYLWCFWQVNYDKALPSGYTYTRNSAFVLRSYASSASADVEALERRIQDLEDSLNEDGATYRALFENLLDRLRREIIPQLEDDLAEQIDDLNERLGQIDGSDVALIRDNDKGLWGVLTSYQDSDDPQKASFADIVANAQNAEIMLKTGSHFFGLDESGYPHGGESVTDITLNKLGAKIDATKTELTSIKNQIDGATFEVNPELIQSAVSKGTLCWEDNNGKLYPYDWHMATGDGDENDRFVWPPETGDESEEDTENKLFFVEYEKYMTCDDESIQPWPSDGPFTRKVILDEFSHISQTADAIEATVTKFQYMWKDRDSGDYFNYNHFEDDYEPVKDNYDGYEDFVERNYNNQYEKVETSQVLSAVTQTAEGLRSMIGDAKYFWERQIDGSPREYEEYAVPEDETREHYEARMRREEWILKNYAESLSVIEQNLDSITLYLDHKVRLWVLKENQTLDPGYEYSYPYDAFEDEYESRHQADESYENYVVRVYSKYELMPVADSVSRIKQTVDEISASVEKIDDLETKLSDLSVRADSVDIFASKSTKVLQLKDTTPVTQRPYGYYYSNFTDTDPSDKSSEKYEEWLNANHPEYEIVTTNKELGTIIVETDSITQALYKNGEIAASIKLLRDLDADEGKIVLSSTKVEIDADLLKINGETFANAVKAYGIQVGTFDDDGNLITNNPELGYAILSSKGLQASGAIISGTITANDGKIGGWAIQPNYLDLYDPINKFHRLRMGYWYDGPEDKWYVFAAGKNWANSDDFNFAIDDEGHMYASGANIYGRITSSEGQIGGFTIDTSKLYNGLSTLNGTSNGVYLGTDGIALGGGKFKVTNQGYLTAASGQIAQFSISENRLWYGNQHQDHTVSEFEITPYCLSLIHKDYDEDRRIYGFTVNNYGINDAVCRIDCEDQYITGLHIDLGQNAQNHGILVTDAGSDSTWIEAGKIYTPTLYTSNLELNKGVINGLGLNTTVAYGNGTHYLDYDNVCLLMTNTMSSTVVLPAFPAAGKIYFIMHASTEQLTISGNGNSIASLIAGNPNANTASTIASTNVESMIFCFTGDIWICSYMKTIN